MKIRIILLLSIITLAFSSCELTGESNYQPSIAFVRAPFVLHGDTLDLNYVDQSTYRLDTSVVGDTIFFPVLLNAYTNNLEYYSITLSDTSATKLLLPPTSSLDSIFSNTASDYQNGKFTFRTTSTTLYFPFRCVVKKASTSAYVSLYVQSNAKLEYNQAGLALKIPSIAPTDTTSVE